MPSQLTASTLPVSLWSRDVWGHCSSQIRSNRKAWERCEVKVEVRCHAVNDLETCQALLLNSEWRICGEWVMATNGISDGNQLINYGIHSIPSLGFYKSTPYSFRSPTQPSSWWASSKHESHALCSSWSYSTVRFESQVSDHHARDLRDPRNGQVEL